MKYCLIGGREIGERCLRALFSNDYIAAAVISCEGDLSPEMKSEIEAQGCAFYEIEKHRGFEPKLLGYLKDNEIQVLLSVAFPFILSAQVLAAVELAVNIHTSELPKYRGVHPITAAFLADEAFQGTTLHIMDPEVDAGDIIFQSTVPVANEDDIHAVKERLVEESAQLAVRLFRTLEQGDLERHPQQGEASLAPKRVPGDNKLDFARDSRYVHNFVRAHTAPYANAFVHCAGQVVSISGSCACNEPGVVLAKTECGKYVLSTANGVVLIETDAELAVGAVLV